MALTGAKALMVWCQQVTNGYKDVNIRNMTSAWRDGLGFCAILHHYRPDLINFDKLSKENIAENNHMAFTIAENELGIAALLDVEDMVEMEVPDKLSILTYISQYYQYFRDKVPGEIPPPARHPSKRHAAFTSHDVPRKKVPGTTPGVSATKEVIGANPTPKMSKGTMDRFCARCRENVYLMERLQVEGRLFHRVCFKCFTCGTQLRMGTYRYIPAEDQFYCDQHYRKRTTSTSSDESRSLQRSGSQQNEQDALQNLLKSLENKRKANEAPKEEIATGSLHTRVENARKMFQQAEHMDTDTDVFHDHKLDNVKVPGKEPSHQPPLRPSTPPVKRTKETDMKVTLPEFLKKSRDLKPVDSKSTENIPPRPVNRPAKKLHASSDDMHHKGMHIGQLKNLYEGAGVTGKAKDVPSRPANPPSPQKTIQVVSADDGLVSNSGGVVHARNFLSNILQKHPNESGHHSQPGLSKGEEAAGVHIYESPFQVNINQHDNSDKGGLDNPRYGEKIEIKPPSIYENEGPSLLSLERNNSADRKEIIDEGLLEEHKDVSRPKSDSVLSSSSEGAKKKKMVLKVKKKKKKDIEQEHKGAHEEEEERVADDSMNKTELQSNKSGAQMTNVNVESIEQNVKETEVDIKEQILDENTEDFEDKNIEPESISKEAIDNQSDLISNNMIDVQDINKDIPDQQNDSEISDETSKQAEEIADEENSSENDVNRKAHSSPNKIAEQTAEHPAEHIEEAPDKVQDNKDEDFVEKDEEDIAPKLKVVKYVNPFEESDDEILDNHDDDDDEAIDRSKTQPSLNPFDMSDEDEIIGNTSEIANSETANTREAGVANPIRIRPGTGPKIQASPEQIQQHQQKISDLKKDMMETGKKPVKYKNPFEDSDDDILDESRCQVKDSKDVKDSEKEAKHRKKLVLKVKKHNKGPAPRPCPEKFGNKVEKTIEESKMEEPTPSNPFEDSDDNLLGDERMETFKAYVENVDIEMDKEKRLDERKISMESNQLDQEESGMISPVSASCPSLVRTRSDGGNNGTEHRPGSSEHVNDRQSILNHHAGRLYSKDIGYVPLEKDNDEKRTKPMLQKEESKEIYDPKGAALKKKEAAPKRPAPPIPKGVQPFKEQKDIEPVPVEGKRVLEVKNNVAVVHAGEKSKVMKEKKEKKDGKKKIVEQKENEESITETKKSKQKLPKTKKKKKNKNKSENKNENENEGNKTENMAKIAKEEPENYFIEENELTLEEIGIELKTIESRQRELERKGVKMEKKLREQLHGEPEENYMITWFDLVTEKNKILRRENELIYMSQEIEYHNNQKRIEYELRLLMEKDESTKTEEDHEAEEQLLAQLVNYVSRRNKIVEKMEEDRLREREEDEQIQMVMRAQGLTKSKKKKAGKKNSSTTFYD